MPEKRIKAYAFRQFQRMIEEERKQVEIKSGKQKQIIFSGYGKIKEQVITYKKTKSSRIVYRDSKGRFTKRPESKIIPEKEQPRQKIFGDLPYYRASVFIEVPYQSNKARGKSNYFWFGIIVIDRQEKINLEEMREDCIKLIEKELGYKRKSLDWFDWEHPSIEYPKPYSASRPDRIEEKWSKIQK